MAINAEACEHLDRLYVSINDFRREYLPLDARLKLMYSATELALSVLQEVDDEVRKFHADRDMIGESLERYLRAMEAWYWTYRNVPGGVLESEPVISLGAPQEAAASAS